MAECAPTCYRVLKYSPQVAGGPINHDTLSQSQTWYIIHASCWALLRFLFGERWRNGKSEEMWEHEPMAWLSMYNPVFCSSLCIHPVNPWVRRRSAPSLPRARVTKNIPYRCTVETVRHYEVQGTIFCVSFVSFSVRAHVSASDGCSLLSFLFFADMLLNIYVLWFFRVRVRLWIVFFCFIL